jgi:predicted proteasome-type protease
MTEEATTNENLTIADLQTIVNIIDTATQRGAFRANELKVVGSVYEKTTAFLESVSEAEKEAAPAAETLKESDAGEAGGEE